VASSVGLVFGWTHNGVPRTKTFALLTGDTIATADSFTIEVPTDQGSPLNYATSYSSNTPGKMHYALTITVESVGGNTNQ